MPRSEGLTGRWLEVAALVAEGYSNKEIARALVLEISTVANHVDAIRRRLGLRNRAHLAAWYALHHESADAAGRRGPD